MSSNPFDPEDLTELPAILPVFPLAGATVLPRTQLPLNIFEPRYLNMVLDALGADRNIGMVQPDPTRPEQEPVATYAVGCAGRIIAFNETQDGRLLISLQGVCRFRIAEELELRRGYRQVRPDWTPYADDLAPEEGFVLERDAFKAVLTEYFDTNGIRVDWKALEKMPDHRLVDFLAMSLPFSPEEKQALLEAPRSAARADILLAAAEMAIRADSEAPRTRH